MKALITIIVLALVAWGIWWVVGGNDAEPTVNNPAAAAAALDFNADASADGEIDLGEFEDKG